MKTITFTCEILTPMFLGDATGGAELRPPAIKAALRFWWRALHAHLDLSDMHKTEAEIFGGGGDDARKSSFDIVIVSNVKEKGTDSERDIISYNYSNRQNPKKIEGVENNPGIEYLFYTFLYLKKEGQYIKPGSSFQIKFIFYNDKCINDVLSAFWLLAHLGNLGSRSRRGAGSFKINNIDNNGITTLNLQFIIPEIDIITFYETNIKTIKHLLEIESIKNNTHSHILDATIYIDNSTHNHNDWQSALNEIGKAMMNFRLNNSDTDIAYRNSHHLHLDKSAAFGLPIRHSNKTIVKPKDYNRRASPLIIKIIEFKKDKYYWIMTHLSGEFLPQNNDYLNIRRDGQNIKANKNALIQFLLALKNNNGLNAKVLEIKTLN